MKRIIQFIVLIVFSFFSSAQPGSIDLSFNLSDSGNGNCDGANNSIKSSIIQNDGKIIITGDFTSYNGVLINRIARLNTDGTLDTSFNINGSGADGVIECVKLQSDAKIIIAGNFTSYNGISITRIARLNNNGSIDTSFNPGAGPNGIIQNFSFQSDGKIIIGGSFSNYNNVRRTCLARIDNTGSLDTDFNIYENYYAGGARGTVYSTAIRDNGDILIGGDFVGYNDRYQIEGLANLFSTGFVNDIFRGQYRFGTPRTISIQNDGKIFVGGEFNYGAGTFNYMRINSDGTMDNYSGSLGGRVNTSIIQSDGKILLGGLFRKGISRLNADGGIDSAFIPTSGANDGINSISIQGDGKIIIAGDFTTYNGTERNRIVRINTDGSIDLTFNAGTGTNNTVYSTSIQSDGKIIMGGDFTLHNGVVQNRLSRLNSNGTIDNSFIVENGPDKSIYDTKIQSDNKILIAGNFNTYNGIAKRYLSRINSDGSLDNSFNLSFDPSNMYVKKIAIQNDGKIIIGGRFRATSGYNYPYYFYINLVRLSIDGAIDISFLRGDPRLHDGDINSISLQSDGKIIISGNFTKYYDSQISRNRITRLNVNGTPDGTFNIGTGANASINNSAIQSDGKIIIGGEFTSFNDINKNYLTRLNTDGSIDNTFNIGTGPNGFINSISVQNDNKIIVTGNFTIFNNTSANRIVRLNSDGTIDTTFNYGEGYNNIIYNPLGAII